MYTSKTFCALLISSLAVFTVQQPMPTLPGACPDFSPAYTSLNISELDGNWYAVYGVKKGIEEQYQYTIKCMEITASMKPNGSLEVHFSSDINGKHETNTLFGSPMDGKAVRFSVGKASDDYPTPMHMTLSILDTDITGYFVSITCTDNGNNHAFFVKVFSRSKTLSLADKLKVEELLHGLDIHDELKPIEQNC